MQDLDQDQDNIQKHVDALMEHFDTVQIFVTRYENEGTTHLRHGSGNVFARRGQIAEWLTKETARDDEEVRESMREEDDDND